VIIFKWSKYPITSLLSIPIASYCSIKRLVLEQFIIIAYFKMEAVTLINPNGITLINNLFTVENIKKAV